VDTERLKANRKRSKTLSYLKKQNIMLSESIRKYVSKNMSELSENEIDMSKAFVGNLLKCANISLYGQTGNAIKLITSITCNHKLCNICNWNRQKKVRRKYFNWFASNETLNKITINGDIKHVTNANLNKYLNSKPEKLKYDLMHLTLTVPHSRDGWKGKKIYFSEIMQAFNQMRKSDEWNRQVYGGEYGVETTRNTGGYHIHIHSLLFVKQGEQNRNRLHLDIMRLWNRLTVDKSNERVQFTENQIKAIKKGNKLMDDVFVNKLNPQGATLIGLECIYTLDNGIKTRTKEWGTDAMMMAVMETISYHFKPKLFNSSEQTYDIETIVEVLPKVYKKVLYRKFGCLHGEKSLNVKDDTLLQDYEETAEEVDEETGEVLQTHFFITNPLNVYAKGTDNEIHVKRQAIIKNLSAKSGREAVKQVIDLSIPKYK